jgi:carboxyl-terminal processing protease
MKSLMTRSLLTLALMLGSTTFVHGQDCPDGKCSLAAPRSGNSWSNSSYDRFSDDHSNRARPIIRSGDDADYRGRYGSDRQSNRESGYNSAGRSYPRTGYDSQFPPLSGFPFNSRTKSQRWNSNPDSRTEYNRRELRDSSFDWRNQFGFEPGRRVGDGRLNSLPDSFRQPALRGSTDRRDFGYASDNRAGSATQIRYRVPLDRPSGNSQYPPIPPKDVDERDFREQYVPVPLPGRAEDDEVRKIFDSVTRRYQSPTLIRSLRSMSGNQAQQMFTEVARKIDERALKPSSYDVRTRRALRNLGVALDNPTFRSALGIRDSFQIDGLRNTLSRIGNSARVSRFEDAGAVMTTVMREAQAVNGLSSAVIAYEFANAQVDTLDRFSALEPQEPVANRGAAVEEPTRSVALEDEIFGIGVEVKEDDRGLLVLKPLRNSPAVEAGLEPGDVIVAINGRNIAGMPMSRSVDLMKTSPNGRMTLRISRGGKGERNFAVAPRRIRLYSVNDTRILSGTNTGYLSLSRFSQKSTSELDSALNQLHSQGMKSLIIDLRGNPGGLLTTCVEISDRFLPCGTIVTTKGRLSVDNMNETASYNRTWSTPLVVLVDGDSASASEIFAAAVQENRRGVVVGTKSYGKGSVQTHFPLTSVSANLRLTTALFYSPNGRRMAGEGVTPDVLINDPDGVANGDEVLAEAIRIAGSESVRELARAAATCGPGHHSRARSSSLENIQDTADQLTALR